MLPRPVQRPRPPLNIAAHGPKTIRLAARYGDGWNTYYPGKDLTPEGASAATRQRFDMLCEFADQEGRDPKKIKRTFLAGFSPDKPFVSKNAFQDFIGRYREAGINDFVLPYLPDNETGGNYITDCGTLERLAKEQIPELTSDTKIT
ncbi:MAG: hypothetical protein Kow002_04220 [Anaerolineales bacterium]